MTTTAEPRIGAHCHGGLKGAVKTARAIGAQAIQIFIGSPQSWKRSPPEAAVVDRFRAEVVEHDLGPVFVHGSYLINLAAQRPPILGKSVASLAWQLRAADRAGAAGLIFHPGSAGTASWDEALPKTVRAMEQVLEGYDGACRLLLETCAGQGATIGCRFEEMRDIMDALGRDERIGVCWDTQHLLASGYDVASRDGLEATVSAFDREVGLDWLCAIHANDSKVPLGARRDRHENIGEGHIGRAAFRRMLLHPALRPMPWILETPGFGGKGPDRESITLLHDLSRSPVA